MPHKPRGLRARKFPPALERLPLAELLRLVRRHDPAYAGYSNRRLVQTAFGTKGYPDQTELRYRALRRQSTNVHHAMRRFCLRRMERAISSFLQEAERK